MDLQATPTPSAAAPPLFMHALRPQWGLAVLTDESADRRSFRFQDGEERTFKQGFYHLLETVERPPDEAEEIARSLGLTLTETGASVVSARPRRKPEAIVRVADQVRIFLHLFPGGFEGERFRTEVRGAPDARPLKRLRAHALATASTLLSAERLDPLLSEGDFAEVHRTALAVAGATNLCSPSDDLKPFGLLEASLHERFARALRGWLWDDGAEVDRFAALVEVLRESEHARDTWPLVTVFAALVHPEHHVCVHPRTFRKQLHAMRPKLTYSSNPTPSIYAGFREMAVELRGTLIDEHELAPADLIDVYAFVRSTLRPKGLRILSELT
ncbi:MAG: hypothetical protein H6739_08370 [Alphaproteobacteria bacterium]|nr:hypothetical protein [Alphaproteobacteria bacterium]